MKKIQFIFCLTVALWINTLNAQEVQDAMRYEYTATFKPDLHDINKIYTEKVFLDVFNSSSRFYSESRSSRTELLNNPNNSFLIGKTISMGKEIPSNFSGEIVKIGKRNYYVDNIGGNMIKLESPLDEIKWNIQEGIEDYNGLKTQKAIGSLNGRTWTVWFSTDIALIEGPYKFKNVPGFVVKAVDDKADYLFEFVKSEKVQIPLNHAEFEIATAVNKGEFIKLRALIANKTIGQMLQEQGIEVNTMDNPDMIEQLKQKIGDHKNYIELIK